MTTAVATPDLVFVELTEDLEDQACDEEECGHNAEWVLHRAACCPDVKTLLLFCTRHKNMVLGLGPLIHCTLCLAPLGTIEDAVTIEPLT